MCFETVNVAYQIWLRNQENVRERAAYTPELYHVTFLD